MSSSGDMEHIPMFSGLGAEARCALAAAAQARSYDDGQVIVLEGDVDVPAFFVIRGAVRVYRTSLEGREQTLIRLRAGDAFNLPAAFADGAAAPATAVAVGAVEVMSIARADFRRLVTETPEIALAALRDLSQKLYHLTDLSYDLGLRSVRARLARFLLAHAQGEENTPTRWTHEEVAAQIGTVREVVSRTLRGLVKDGLIELQRHRIVILDREALACEAES